MIDELEKAGEALRKAANMGIREGIGIGSMSPAGIVRTTYGINALAGMLGAEMSVEEIVNDRKPKFDSLRIIVEHGGIFFTQEVSRQFAIDLGLAKEGDKK